jgi:hypothetical protein
LQIKKSRTNELEEVIVKQDLYSKVKIGQFIAVTFQVETYAPKKWYNFFNTNFPKQDKNITDVSLLPD